MAIIYTGDISTLIKRPLYATLVCAIKERQNPVNTSKHYIRKYGAHGRYSTQTCLNTLIAIILKTTPETIHTTTAMARLFLSNNLNTPCLSSPLGLLPHLWPRRLGRVQRVVDVHQHADRQHDFPRPWRLQPAAVEAVRLGQEPGQYRLLLHRLRVLQPHHAHQRQGHDTRRATVELHGAGGAYDCRGGAGAG